MPTNTGFTKYTPEKIYELDNINPKDVTAIAQLKGFQTPLTEEQRSQVREFAQKAKERGLTINQAVQLASKAQQVQPVPEKAPKPDPMGTVTGEFSASAQQKQLDLMQAKIDAAVEDWALGQAATNLAIAQLVASGGNLSKYPHLEAMVNQSKSVRQAVEAANPALLPFDQMMTIALGDVQILDGKLPALPTTTTLTLPAATEAI